MPIDYSDLKNRLWRAADELRANSKLRSHEYSAPVLGLIFLRYADVKFSQVQTRLEATAGALGFRRRALGPDAYKAEGAIYLQPETRFKSLVELPEGENIGQRINEAMKLIEADNKELDGVLPKNYNRLENSTLATLLKSFNAIPMEIEGDVFGKIYEYFLGQFAKAEGQRGGEFFTPTSLVKLIVEVIEPYHGRIFDPASGSGGMFVQSANFVARHQGNPSAEISLYGQEKTAETVRLARMNLAVNGLEGDVRQGNTYYEDLHRSGGKFDFVMANPPFNVNNVDKERLKDDPRFPFGLPRTDNANYLWIQLFYSALNETGRAGFVMANSASDARQSELGIRRKLIEAKAVDVMIAIGSNFFLTVTLPCTLWFLDRGKAGTSRENTVLFIDARPIYRQVDRALREFTDEQVLFIANIVRLYRGEPPDWTNGAGEHPRELPGAGGRGGAGENGSNNRKSEIVNRKSWEEFFPTNTYRDIPGLCKVATLAEIESQGWSLNPGRYVGVADRAGDDGDFAEQLEELNEELELLNAEARELEARIAENVSQILEGRLE